MGSDNFQKKYITSSNYAKVFPPVRKPRCGRLGINYTKTIQLVGVKQNDSLYPVDFIGRRCWYRTSDLFRVKEALYH
jgi:hypothetical protein